MEEDFLNYLPTVMFRGTPCTFDPQLKSAHSATQMFPALKNYCELSTKK